MESVPFETIWGGVIVAPGMLVFIDKKRQIMAKIRGFVRGKKEKIEGLEIELAGGAVQTVPLKQVSDFVSRDPYNLAQRTPPEFLSIAVLSVALRDPWLIDKRFRKAMRDSSSLPTFKLGDEVLFLNEEEMCRLTGHLEMQCIGRVQMIDEAGNLYISFIANPNSPAPSRWFFRCLPEELMVVTLRESLGTYGVKLHVSGVYGEGEVDIHLAAPPSRPKD